MIPYQWEALNDRVEGAAPSFCMRNFRIAGKLNRERREKGDHLFLICDQGIFEALTQIAD